MIGSIKTVMTQEQLTVVSELHPCPSSPAPGSSGNAHGRCTAPGRVEPCGRASGTMPAL